MIRAADIPLGRALTLLFVGWVGLIVVASLQAVVPLAVAGRAFAPDVALLVVLFLGFERRGGTARALGLAVALGYVADLFAGSPKGLHMLAYGLIFLASRGAASRLLVRGAFYIALVALFFAAGFGLLAAALRASFEPGVGWTPLRQVPLAALGSALVAPLLFPLLSRLDRSFAREPSSLGGAR